MNDMIKETTDRLRKEIKNVNEKDYQMKSLTYLIYIIFWEGALLYGAYDLVFVKGGSNWLLLLFIWLSTKAYKPNLWIYNKEKAKNI